MNELTNLFSTTKQLAEKYGVREGSIRQYILRGQLEAVKVGNNYLITHEQEAAWVSTRKPRQRRRR